MIRDYSSGIDDSATFFIGDEVEKTPAYGKKTLFVVGNQQCSQIEELCLQNNITHIFFGANHSFAKSLTDKETNEIYDSIVYFLKKPKMFVSLDIPLEMTAHVLESAVVEYHNFIPQIRVPIPFINQWGYNAMLKIDDEDFNYSNPGVWTHPLHELKDRSKYTDWNEYRSDRIINPTTTMDQTNEGC